MNKGLMVTLLVGLFCCSCGHHTPFKKVSISGLLSIEVPMRYHAQKHQNKEIDILYSNLLNGETIIITHTKRENARLDTTYFELTKDLSQFSLGTLENKKYTQKQVSKVNNMTVIQGKIDIDKAIKGMAHYAEGLLVMIEGKKNIYQIMIVGYKKELLDPKGDYQAMINSFKEL